MKAVINMMLLTMCVCHLVVLANGEQQKKAVSFSEELFIETLSDFYVHFFFQFNSAWTRTNQTQSYLENYDLFPKRIGDIVSKFGIDELHLSLTQGNWKYDEWGLPTLSAPSGAELWAVFDESLTDKAVDANWLQSSRAISGLFGLSINLNDNPNTVKPKYSTGSGGGGVGGSGVVSKHTRYASIPNEIVCTENLTPWVKLLPCGKTKGIARLFKNPHKLFDSRYFSTGLHFKKAATTCRSTSAPDCVSASFELKQTLSVVYNSELFLKGAGINQPTMWSLQTVFNQKIDSVCPIADRSNVYMSLGAHGASNTPPDSKFSSSDANKEIYSYDLRQHLVQTKEFNPTLVLKKNPPSGSRLITLHRYVTEANERSFGLKTLLTNPHAQHFSAAVYFDTIPWYFRVFISSLSIHRDNDTVYVKPESIHFVPGLDRKRAHLIEIKLDLQPHSVYSISYRVECAYLKWDEFPPDVNHGFYINPVLVQLNVSGDAKTFARTFAGHSTIYDNLHSSTADSVAAPVGVYSEALLMNLPTPDFSMPYNVICLTCTVIAIGFGSVHNFTTRKFVFAEKKSIKQKARAALVKLVSSLFKKNGSAKATQAVQTTTCQSESTNDNVNTAPS